MTLFHIVSQLVLWARWRWIHNSLFTVPSKQRWEMVTKF